MLGKHLFEYSVIRIVPRVEREEFLNVGVVLYCSKKHFLKMVYKIDPKRLSAFGNGYDVYELEEYLRAFERICAGGNNVKPIGTLPIAERFRWLTATRSTVVQTSKVHPGFCEDPGEMLGKLFNQLVAVNA